MGIIGHSDRAMLSRYASKLAAERAGIAFLATAGKREARA